jgi:hypothetical protein
LRLIDAQYQMVVIRDDDVGADVDGKDLAQYSKAREEPLFAVFIVLASQAVLATQEGLVDTAAVGAIVGSSL